MTTDELLTKLPSHIGRNKFHGFYIPDNKRGGDIGWLYLHNDGKDWCASYGREGNFVCLNPDAEKPPYNNAVAYGKTPNEALKGLYDWCVKNGFINEQVMKQEDLIPKFGEFSDNEPLDIPTMTTDFIKEHGLPCPNGYIFKDENGNVINATKIVLEKKKKEYPKTFEECCKILGLLNVDLCFNADYRSFAPSKEQWKRLGLMNQFYQLIICRDAYWKLYGEEMGLGKPWKLSIGTPIYYIYYNKTVSTIKNDYADDIQGNVILAFPTEEMRDAFYENFKKEIEMCKELL